MRRENKRLCKLKEQHQLDEELARGKGEEGEGITKIKSKKRSSHIYVYSERTRFSSFFFLQIFDLCSFTCLPLIRLDSLVHRFGSDMSLMQKKWRSVANSHSFPRACIILVFLVFKFSCHNILLMQKYRLFFYIKK